MNKLVKGSIAGGLGIALLLGGASTFALWNDAVTTPAGTITSGELKIVDKTAADGVWTDVSTTGQIGTTVVTGKKMVPGDTWRYTDTITVTTTGKNLLADLGFDASSITAAAGLSGLTPNELTYSLGATAVAASGASTLTSNGTGTNSFRITPGTAATTDVTVTFDVTYVNITTGATAVNNNSGQNKAIDVTGLKFTLKQVRGA